MSIPVYYALPLLSGLLYAVGALLTKRAFACGFGLTRYIFLSNMAMALLFQVFWIFAEFPSDPGKWYWPVLCGVGFFLGQVFTFLAIRAGDVSVQAPVMGTKVLFVAVFTVVLGAGAVPLSWWAGAALTVLAIWLLSASSFANRAATYRALVLSLISAACFAWVDTIVQREARPFGTFAFLGIMSVSLAFCTLALIPFFRGSLRSMSAKAWLWGALSAFLIAIQSLGIAISIGFYGRATAVNIMYSSRGLWSVLLVWVAGRLFANEEGKAGTSVMLRRLFGAVLLSAAIILVLLEED